MAILNIKKICILGGTGYLGQACVAHFSQLGYALVVPSRHPERARELSVYKGVRLVRADVFDSEVLTSVLSGVDAVINLIDLQTEDPRRDMTFNKVNVEFVRKLMGVMRKQGVKRLLGLSTLNLDSMIKQTTYQRSKAQAEQAMSSSYEIQSTAIRPSVIYGPSASPLVTGDWVEDLASRLQRNALVPVLSAQTRISPIFIQNFLTILEKVITDTSTFGKAIEVCGPEAMTRGELAKRLRQFMGLKTWVLPLPRWLSWLVLPFVSKAQMTKEELINLQKDQVCSELAYRPRGLEWVSIGKSLEAYDFVEGLREKYHRYRQYSQR
jgi:nucleoside-diphosphate-sugar epimerase